MPRGILNFMNSPSVIPGLTRANISSHLQKYRKKVAAKKNRKIEEEEEEEEVVEEQGEIGQDFDYVFPTLDNHQLVF